MKRRSFLRLAAGVPLFSIANLWAAPLARRVAQGGKVRLALIGCGAQMTGLVRRLGGDGAVEIAAMVDPDPRGIAAVKASAVKFYGKFDFSRTWTGADYREMSGASRHSADCRRAVSPPDDRGVAPRTTLIGASSLVTDSRMQKSIERR